MASCKVMSFAIFALSAAALVAANALTPEDSVRGCAWCPRPVACNYTETPGASCLDCKNKLICTPIGGIQLPCYWSKKNNCVDGECGPEPSEECAPTTTTKAVSTQEPETEVPEGSNTKVLVAGENEPSEPEVVPARK